MRLPLNEEEKRYYAQGTIAMVYHIVGKFQSSGAENDDLVGSGMIGLTKALNSFDKDRDIKFSTYAFTCIRNEILHFLRKENVYNYNVVLSGSGISTDDEGNVLTIEDIKGTNKDFVESGIELSDDLILLYEKIELLNEKEKFVLIHRFGLKGAKILTQSEVGQILGMSQPYICRMEKGIRKKLFKSLEGKIRLEDTGYYKGDDSLEYQDMTGDINDIDYLQQAS